MSEPTPPPSVFTTKDLSVTTVTQVGKYKEILTPVHGKRKKRGRKRGR
jgi:hypothetical protein